MAGRLRALLHDAIHRLVPDVALQVWERVPAFRHRLARDVERAGDVAAELIAPGARYSVHDDIFDSFTEAGRAESAGRPYCRRCGVADPVNPPPGTSWPSL